MKNIQEIKNEFEQILSEVIKINGISVESATQVAQVILQESGKFQRTEMMNQARLNSNGNTNNGNGNNNGYQPATNKQKIAMENLEIKFNKNISKTEASRLIEQAISQLRSNGKGRVITAPSF